MQRYLHDQIVSDLAEKMVFIGGPRQVGKTTLARQIISSNKACLNWDIPDDRQAILNRKFPPVKALIFDEIHKYRGWRNYLKGLYDKQKSRLKILVTGSARLDYYRFGGDSLQGRYHYLRLHPLSAAELGITGLKDLKALLELGGFPEPFLHQDTVKAKRWSLEYRQRLIREDIVSLEAVQDLGNLELLILRLPELVGSPLSINALREDLRVNHRTVDKWLAILERLHAIFRLSPFGAPRIRAVKKEQKHYHFDWSLVPDKGFRFENMVACHLLKWANYLYDAKGREIELRYYRDVYRREIDFVITENRKPVLFVECKYSDAPIAEGLYYLKKFFPDVPAWQISMEGKKDYESPEGIRVCP
ncbi:MAG: ATP-binding protein, partial [Deltaproteobacteria bacterium]|nr:ATP-binding protein [Deltaproteobacteria bacterium]